jgi:hypothetical protein
MVKIDLGIAAQLQVALRNPKMLFEEFECPGMTQFADDA